MTEEERERLATQVDLVQGLLTQARGLLLTIQGRFPRLAEEDEYWFTKQSCTDGGTSAGQLADRIRTEKEREWKA